MSKLPLINRNNDYTVLTPYLIPLSLAGKKTVNIGDGLILRAIERLMGRFTPERIFSPRVKPSNTELAALALGRGIILAGANQLNDHFRVWPGLKAEDIRSNGLRFIPFGVGLHGEAGYTKGLSVETLEVLRAVHERIEYSSWRCPPTVRFLESHLPELKGRMLMTGCPVTYDEPLLNGKYFLRGARRIAVTVTERFDFWERETKVIDYVARRFPQAQRFLVLHQNYSPATWFEPIKHRLLPYNEVENPCERLRWYAARRGFRVVSPSTQDDCITFYQTIDLHIGSRLHAHLYFISQGKWTFVIAIDGRATGMAEYLGFPLCDPNDLDAHLDFDFEIVRDRALAGYDEMKRFTKALRDE